MKYIYSNKFYHFNNSNWHSSSSDFVFSSLKYTFLSLPTNNMQLIKYKATNSKKPPKHPYPNLQEKRKIRDLVQNFVQCFSAN